MQKRHVGRSGLEVSLVGLGCNNFGGRIDDAATRAVVHAALDAGVTFFDVADAYGTPRGRAETLLAEALGPRRKDVVIATKFGLDLEKPGFAVKSAARGYIMQAVEASLKRLNTDYIDLYQQHRPDRATPIEETLRALDDLVRQGKVRYIGSSHMPAWQVTEALRTSRAKGLAPFIACEDEYSLLARGAETDLLPAIRAQRLGLLPFFPLASGFLTGKYRRNRALPEGARLTREQGMRERYITDRNLDIAEKLEDFARARGHTVLELAFAWLAARPEVSCIIAGATSPAQIAANAATVDWTLSPEDFAAVNAIAAA